MAGACASSEVARARALPLKGPGRGSAGYVGIVLVPHSRKPSPTVARARARCSLPGRRAPAGMAGGIRIVAPSYVPSACARRSAASRTRRQRRGLVRMRIKVPASAHRRPRRTGWDFGESVYLSDMAELIEDMPGVEAVRCCN